MKILSEARLNEIGDYVYGLYEQIKYIHEEVKMGNEIVISRSMALQLMGIAGKGRNLWFTVEFIKRSDGAVRRINGMTGVRKYVRGIGLPYNQKEKRLITIFDRNAPGEGKNKYRQVPIDNITRLSINRKIFKVVDDSQYNTLNRNVDRQTDQEPIDPNAQRSQDQTADRNTTDSKQLDTTTADQSTTDSDNESDAELGDKRSDR